MSFTLPLPIRLFHMCMEVLCQGFWVEALPGSTSWSLSLKRCRKLSVCKSLRSFQLGTVFSSGTCHKRRSDGDRPEFGHPHKSSQVLEGSGQKHQLLLVQFLPRVPNLTRHIASKWVGSCYCWSPIIQTKAWKPTISLVLSQLSRQEKLWSRPGWNIMK